MFCGLRTVLGIEKANYLTVASQQAHLQASVLVGEESFNPPKYQVVRRRTP
jgi:hypothetical protein